jgi:DNA-binding MarR family transcriptional regulator
MMSMTRATTPRANVDRDPDDELAAELRLVVGRLGRKLRQVHHGGLTASQNSALHAIEALGPVRLGDLAAAEGISAPTLTKIVDHLETAGFVGRNVDPQDRRVVRVALTDQGREKVKGLREDRTAYLRRRLAELQPRDRATLRAALPLLSVLADEAAR